MYADYKILAVVPARGGSKGVPLKNIQPIQGIPLVARVGHLISELPEIDRAVVSTDHDEIARIAEASGLAADWRRPPALSGDRIGDLDVLTHALNETEQRDGQRYDIVLMLQPTSPMRTAAHVRDTYRKLIDEGRDAVWTVSETDSKYHPRKQLTLTDDQLGYYSQDGGQIIARQQLDALYHRNGAAYAFTRDCLVEQRNIMGANTAGLITEDMVSIDTPFDFRLVEFLLADKH
ncbi:cytidylyltransferase domain-containing protein [Salinisphaera hydrothermalis]|uniref:CMP-N-acetylneuraminic acid synthetase n=1 Tax=Salinisphaera hydrothermalis (strain C41B8) TaxID=1304275 RepID=A0A084IKW8_SALHC|nr:acylneuraminate cytidylyltransferase family protein [Salinisphaera hydrothermalis]KEZ77352.1 CMP-N-acetylneuraminic acid synthetase [Salinisphaera hydrothermalis C41B8]